MSGAMLSLVYDKVSSSDGAHQVGKISKQWSGLLKEFFTDADNFGVSCMCHSLTAPHIFLRIS